MLIKSIVHYIYISFTMAQFLSLDDITSVEEGTSTAMQLLDTNWQTTAAVGLTVATAGVGGVVMLSVLPAQTIAASAGVGLLAYAGKRRADGKDALPFISKKSDDTQDKAEATEPAAA